MKFLVTYKNITINQLLILFSVSDLIQNRKHHQNNEAIKIILFL